MRRHLLALLTAAAWLAGVVGIYFAFFALGARIWSYAALAVGALLVSGLLKLAETLVMRSDTRIWAFGTVKVTEVSAPPQGVLFGRCEMRVVTDAAGMRPREVLVREPRVPVDSWPEVGAILPAQIGVPNSRRVRIQWDRMASSSSSRFDPSRTSTALGSNFSSRMRR
jgi:hypothetical protein